MRIKRLITLAASLLAPLPVAAQSDVAPWTEDRAVARAVTHAPEVRRAAALLREAQARRAFGDVSPIGNPVVAVRAMVGVPDIPAATYALVVGVPFDLAGARSRRRSEGAHSEREAEARVEVAVNDARARARFAWVEAALADESLRVAARRAMTAREILARVREQADAHAATALDVTLAERESALADAERAVVARARELALSRLRDALDLTPGEAVDIAPLGLPAVPTTSVAEVLAAARLARAEPRVYAAASARMRAAASRLRAEAIAPLIVNGEVEWQGYSQSSVGLSAQWALPLTRTAQGERAEAMASSQTAALEAELATRASSREALAALAALRHAVDELRVLTERVLPASERAVELTEALRANGAVEFFRVLSARQELALAQSRRIEALREAWRARLELDRATATNPFSRSSP